MRRQASAADHITKSIMEIDSKELEVYLEAALFAIKKGVEGKGNFRISQPVEFNLAVTNITEGKGGLKIYVVDAGRKVKSEKVSHIKISASPDRRKESGIVSQYRPNGTNPV